MFVHAAGIVHVARAKKESFHHKLILRLCPHTYLSGYCSRKALDLLSQGVRHKFQIERPGVTQFDPWILRT